MSRNSETQAARVGRLWTEQGRSRITSTPPIQDAGLDRFDSITTKAAGETRATASPSMPSSAARLWVPQGGQCVPLWNPTKTKHGAGPRAATLSRTTAATLIWCDAAI